MFKNRLKLRIVAMIIACLAVIFVTSCNKDDDDPATSAVKTITAQVEGGSNLNSKIDEVRVFASYRSGNSWNEEEIAKGAFANGSFTINLPDPLASKFLAVWNEDNVGEGISVSNKSVKMTEGANGVWFVAYKGGVQVGEIYYESNNFEAWLIYVDSNVDITGSNSENYDDWTVNHIFSMSLKTGWNFVYSSYSENTTSKTETFTTTTTEPSGLKWVFYEDD